MTADEVDELLVAIAPGDLEALLRVVDVLLDEHEGQLTGGMLHHIGRLSGPDDFVRAALKRRARWYRARGLRIPKLPRSEFTWE